MNAFESIWNELGADCSATTGVARRRIEKSSQCDIFLGMEKPQNNRLLLIEFPTVLLAAGTNLPKSRGFEVTATPLVPGPNGQVRLTLHHTQKAFPEIFLTLCVDVSGHVARASSPQQAVMALISRLAVWQKFLEKHSPEGLSEDAQLGLFGELWFLRNHLIGEIGPEAAVAAWTGPNGANQDFQAPGVAIEVKTTRANTHQNLHISNVRQLDETGIDALLIYQVSLDARQGGTQTLNSMVVDIRGALETAPTALLDFNDRLMGVGYHDLDAKRYEDIAYTHRAHHFFRVVEGFPRIVERDLRDGVGDVRYTVALAACMPFVVGDQDAHNRISVPTSL